MPREITFKIGESEYSAVPMKVDRRKLYGWTELNATDDDGRPCELLTADESGKFIIPLGGTASGIISPSGLWVERSELVAVDENGKPVKLYESSFNTVNLLKHKVNPKQFLDYAINDFYELTDAGELAKAVGEDIYLFDYTYNASYETSPALVMAAQGTLFLLVGVKNLYEPLCFGDCKTINDEYADDLIEQEDAYIDFSMF